MEPSGSSFSGVGLVGVGRVPFIVVDEGSATHLGRWRGGVLSDSTSGPEEGPEGHDQCDRYDFLVSSSWSAGMGGKGLPPRGKTHRFDQTHTGQVSVQMCPRRLKDGVLDSSCLSGLAP